MKIDIRPVLKNYRGKEMFNIDEDGKREKLTVRLAINSALNGVEINPNGQRKPLTAEKKGRISQLSTKLWDARKEVNFTDDERVFIKKRAGDVVNVTPLIYGRLCDLLEAKNEKKPKGSSKEKSRAKA